MALTPSSPAAQPRRAPVLCSPPLALLGGRVRPKTAAQIACLIFASVYLFYWELILSKVRYAIAAFGLLAVLVAAWG